MLKRILLLFLFSIAMAYMEAAIVVYLRLLYYPSGFYFPMVVIPGHLALTEIGREISTLIMIWVIAMLVGQNFRERFSFFCLTFGIWDLFYYGWLFILIDWPASFLDWDILFLIPLPWIAPWLAPALVSIALICASLIVLLKPERFNRSIFNKYEWGIIVLSGLLMLSSFFYQTKNVLNQGIPDYYPWWLFLSGYFIGIFVFIRRYLNPNLSKS